MADFLPGWSSLFGSKPKVPGFTPVNIDQTEIDAARGNLGVLPYAGEIASRTNTLNQSELDRMNAAALPFYDRIKQQVGQNAVDDVSGIIPQSVQDNISRASAGQAVYGGFGGSGRQVNLTGGKFADETFARRESGMNSAQRWLQTSRTPLYDLTRSFVDSGTRLQAATQSNEQQWNQKWLKSQINSQAMPGPLRDYSY